MDDLNYYQSMRHDLLQIAIQFNARSIFIYVNTPLETCLEWNATRDTKVPPEIIEKIAGKFDEFTRYAWDRPDFTANPSSPDFSEPAFLEDLCAFISQNTVPKHFVPSRRERQKTLT